MGRKSKKLFGHWYTFNPRRLSRSDGETLERAVIRASWPMARVNTDVWGGYNGLPAMGRSRPTVCHADLLSGPHDLAGEVIPTESFQTMAFHVEDDFLPSLPR
jgi:hypothetical protein